MQKREKIEFQIIAQSQKMPENRSEDALFSLVKTAETVETVENVKIVEIVETVGWGLWIL